ncbi:MAG: phasin family protein [Rhodoferax sp.]|nr:phasin family protein [Rhodoferax sp.]
MTALPFEPLIASQKNLIAILENTIATAFSGFEQLVGLHLTAARALIVEPTGDMLAILGASNPNDALAAQAALVKPLLEKSLHVGQEAYTIVAETGAELSEIAETTLTGSQLSLVNATQALSVGSALQLLPGLKAPGD